MPADAPIPVALWRLLEYESTLLDRAAALLLEECGYAPARGDAVLVKPNLVSPKNAALSCTNPRVVAAVCAWLLDHGARVTVADSPAAAPVGWVARACGLDAALRPLGLKVRGLGAPRRTALPGGGSAGVSRLALKADVVLNLPKLKAHCQFRVTAAVKNLFGVVSGVRKALAHARLGPRPGALEGLVMGVARALPPVVSLLDGVYPMHRTGPIGGEACTLGLLAASADPVALDTAVYALLGLKPKQVPLWAEARRMGLPGARTGGLAFPLEPLDAFDASGFEVPRRLEAMEFEPLRVLRGRFKGLLPGR